ncbi:MAG: hypothetical protein AB7O57_12545 [Hyphomicrobiaceae bacterium]
MTKVKTLAPTKEEFLATPYDDRRLIVVLDDELIGAIRNSQKESTQPRKATRSIEVSFDMGFGAEISVDVGKLVSVTAEAAKLMLGSVSKVVRSGGDILPIEKSLASTLVFPPGHPRAGTVYVGHPVISARYLTFASFHRTVFEHKFSEAIYLLMSLGATKIKVEHISGWAREFSGTIAAPLGVAGDLSATASKSAATKNNMLYEAELKGAPQPEIPSDLVWFKFEPTWEAIARGRLDFGLKSFSLAVSYEDDYGVNAGLKNILAKSGLEISGKFVDHEATVWNISGEFREQE